MATAAQDFREEPFAARPPAGMAYAMALVVVAAFSLQFAMGRSSIYSPLLTHAHAVVFMGWVAIFVAQVTLATRGRIDLHRKLGRLAAGWLVLMIVLGFAVTLNMVRRGTVPFFFQPQHFLIFDPLNILVVAAMVGTAIALRRRTDWHARLQFGAMALLMGPAFGRLLPMPLLAPYAYESAALATAVFPLIGMGIDRKRTGRVHPAWLCTLGVLAAMVLLGEAITYSPLGDAVYRGVTAGSPGGAVAGLEFPDPPSGTQITGR